MSGKIENKYRYPKEPELDLKIRTNMIGGTIINNELNKI
jgi:hypothetical protein